MENGEDINESINMEDNKKAARELMDEDKNSSLPLFSQLSKSLRFPSMHVSSVGRSIQPGVQCVLM